MPEDDLDALYGNYEPDEDDIVDEEDDTPRGRAAAAKKKEASGKKPAKDRVLVFDEALGRTVIQRNRKPGRVLDILDEEE